MSRNITARDYLPSQALRRIDRRNAYNNQRRIDTFLPRLDAHGFVDTEQTISGFLEITGYLRLTNSTEYWVRGVIHTQDMYGDEVSHVVVIPRRMANYSHGYVTVDISASDVRWVDSRTGDTVYSKRPVVLRRHA